MNVLKWLGFTQQNQRYGPDFYELILSRSGGNAHALRINIFYVRRIFSLIFLILLTAGLWLGYMSYQHHQLSQEIAELEETKAHLRKLEQEKRKQRIAHDVMEHDFSKLAARIYDVEQQVQKIQNRDKWSKSLIGSSSTTEANMGKGGELIQGDTQNWMQNQALPELNHLEKQLSILEKLPRGMPVPPERTRLSSPFGYRGNPFNGRGREFHNGLDFASPTGTPIYATAPGKITVAGPRGGLGNAVKIEHNNNFQTMYGHMSKVLVRTGTHVDAGDLIGLVGSTGRSSGPHLHYIVFHNNVAIDPIDFVN